MGFRKTIRESHKEYIACILADEITDALKGTAHEMIVPSTMLYTKDGISEAQSDTLEEKHPDVFEKYMVWHTAFLKEQIGYAQEIVRVQANTERIRKLTELFRKMNAANS